MSFFKRRRDEEDDERPMSPVIRTPQGTFMLGELGGSRMPLLPTPGVLDGPGTSGFVFGALPSQNPRPPTSIVGFGPPDPPSSVVVTPFTSPASAMPVEAPPLNHALMHGERDRDSWRGFNGWTAPDGVYCVDCRFSPNDSKDPVKTQQSVFWKKRSSFDLAGLCECGTSADSVIIIGDSRARSFIAYIRKVPFNQKKQPLELANILVSSWAAAGFEQLVLRAEHYIQLGAGRNMIVFCGGINDVISLFSQRTVPERSEWTEAAAHKLRPLREFFIKHEDHFITPMIVEVFGVKKKYNRLTDDAKQSVNEFLKFFNQALRDICNEYFGVFVSASDLNLDLSRDGIHINYRNNFVMNGAVVTNTPKRQKSERDSIPQTVFAHHLRKAIQKELKVRGCGYTSDI